MLYRWAAEAAATPPDVITAVLQWGVPGVVVALLLLGWLVPKGAYEQMRTDRNDWKSAYEKEVAAHTATREALSDSAKSGSAAVETARTTAALLSTLGHSTSRPGGSG